MKEPMSTIIPDYCFPFLINYCFELQHQIYYLTFVLPKMNPYSVFKTSSQVNVKFFFAHFN